MSSSDCNPVSTCCRPLIFRFVWGHSAASQKNQWHCACGVKETGAVGSFPRCFFSFGSEKVDCAAGGVFISGEGGGRKGSPVLHVPSSRSVHQLHDS
ncbi:unnamed protein product [Musa acuminata subsp. malaccensis]|uniref:(wild Malaysian banana) hypothetical protein n=1 Tax=Musa acuminata subsp. malaccensis TaxID=214687 RepID=A0A804K363_MUSAM|nr:unnamed protein product [Musa acuminata subsp. malaccensis]